MNRALFVIWFAAALLRADDAASKAAVIIASNCTACHGDSLQASHLDLRTFDSILKGGDRGPAVVPGKAAESRLFRFISGMETPSMPPGRKLTPQEIATIEEWIDSGEKLGPMAAPTPEQGNAALAKSEERPITDAERKWWAFQTPDRKELPGDGNPIDRFLAVGYAKKGLHPSARAEKRVLVRRAYLDLLGLPPTPAQVDEFVNDANPLAWEHLIDQLLANPHYGERWARHWMDLVRYADSGGYEYDREFPNSWRYRDYVIRAFNSDKPYDTFLKEQLAGDEYKSSSPDGIIATGYLRLGPENNLKNEQTRMDELDDLVATTGNAFLGMTLGCARCHNHKFDPIPQKDYYRMQAVFFPTKAWERPLVSAAEEKDHQLVVAAIVAREKPLKLKIESIEKPTKDKIVERKHKALPDYMKLALATPAEKRSEGQRLTVAQVTKTLTATPDEIDAEIPNTDRALRSEVRMQIAALEEEKPEDLPAAMTVKEPGRVPPASFFLHRGSPAMKGGRMEPGVLTVAAKSDYVFPQPPEDASSSWRRRGLAEWIASAGNPLTARVMVNRIWAQHFGEGIVRSLSNFGKMGERPSNLELLDWLSTELVRSGWSVKAMQRLMMTSDAYQMVSDDTEVNRKIDPDNRYVWRMPRRRLEGEIIRDEMLAVSGTLNSTIGGKSVFPYIDPALFQSSSKRTWNGRAVEDPSTWRRSLYIFSKRSIPLPMLEVFDKPDSIKSCDRRNRSTIAPQALILMNNSFVQLLAKQFAQRLEREAGTATADQIRLAYRLSLSRPPTQAETERAQAFIEAGPHGLVDFAQALFNINEFVYMP